MFEKIINLLKGRQDEPSKDELTVVKIIEKYRSSLKTHPSFIENTLYSQDCLFRLGVEENEYLHVSLHLGKELEVDTVHLFPWQVGVLNENWPLHESRESWGPLYETYYSYLKYWRNSRGTTIYRGSLKKASPAFKRFILTFFKEKMDEWVAKENELSLENRKWRAEEAAKKEKRKQETVKSLLS